MRSRVPWALCAVLSAITLAAPAAQERPTLESILTRAGEYVRQLHVDLSGVVADEHYTQDIVRAPASMPSRETSHRDLRSDVLLVRPEGADRFIQFRDVYEVDGKPVRDRDDRLAMLFLHPAPSAQEQLQEIKEDSARYNIGGISRDFNVPVLALTFLLPENQSRFRFSAARAAGSSLPIDIDFREIRPQTLIRTTADRDLPSRGRFRIDPGSGRVLTSQLIVEDNVVHADVAVDYQMDPLLGFLVPREMRESVGTRQGTLEIKGKATYVRFRRFEVTTEEKVR